MNATTPTAKPPVSRWLVPMLGGLTALAPLTVDMYLPAFPEIAGDLNTSAGLVQSTLATYFIGMAIGQMFYGPLSDRYGRKLPLYVGLAVYAVASLGSALAPNIHALLVFRLLQALGGCVTLVVSMAMVRDLFDPQSSARVLSRLVLVMGVAPLLAPMLGSQLLLMFGWRGIFWVLFAYALLSLIVVCFFIPESLDPARAKSTSVAIALRTYSSLLKDRQYLGYVLAGSLGMAGMFAYIAGSPFVLIEVYGFSPRTFSLAFGANVIGLIGASQVNHYLLARHPPGRILRTSLPILATVGLVLFIETLTGLSHATELVLMLLSLFVYMSSLGFVNANTPASAMAGHAHQAGSAAALMGTIQFALATLAAMAVGSLNDGTAHAMSGVMAVSGVAALLCHHLMVRPYRTGS